MVTESGFFLGSTIRDVCALGVTGTAFTTGAEAESGSVKASTPSDFVSVGLVASSAFPSSSESEVDVSDAICVGAVLRAKISKIPF